MIVEVGNSDDRVIMTHELRIAHLRIAPQEGNLDVGNCEGNQFSDDEIKSISSKIRV